MKTKIDKFLDQCLIQTGVKKDIISPYFIKRQEEFVQEMKDLVPNSVDNNGVIDVMYLSSKAKRKSDLIKDQNKSCDLKLVNNNDPFKS